MADHCRDTPSRSIHCLQLPSLSASDSSKVLTESYHYDASDSAATTIVVRGACRISDVRLGALVKCAPALRSLNPSQCSLLTDTGITYIANLLGSNMRELYLDECDSLDAKCILPALKELKHLKVLSLRGLASVSDKFMVELIGSNGQNMKELLLGNCGFTPTPMLILLNMRTTIEGLR